MELLIDQRYPEANTYSGKAEKCEFGVTVMTSPLDGWMADRFALALVEKTAEHGGRMLTLKVWQEVTIPPDVGEFGPIPYTTIRGEAIATASPLWWNAIILGALAVVGLLLIAFTTLKVTELFWGEGDKEDGKKLLPSLDWIPVVAIATLGYLIYREWKKP